MRAGCGDVEAERRAQLGEPGAELPEVVVDVGEGRADLGLNLDLAAVQLGADQISEAGTSRVEQRLEIRRELTGLRVDDEELLLDPHGHLTCTGTSDATSLVRATGVSACMPEDVAPANTHNHPFCRTR